MAGISTAAPLKLANQFKYNGKLLNHKEFSTGGGLDWYSYGFRTYDPQTGRFIQQDPLMGSFASVSPYQYALNEPVANIDAGGLGVVELPELTVFAKAPGMLSSLGHIASKLFTGAASIAGNAGSVLGNIAPMAGELGTLTHPGIELEHTLTVIDGWYVDKNGQIQFSKNVNSSMDAAKLGGHYLGQTYKGIVMANGMKYAFSGGANGSATLSRSLNPVNVVAYKPRGAGAFGPYIPTNKELSLMLAVGTLPFGGEGLLADLGISSGLTSLGGRFLLEASGRGLVNAGAQYAGNRIANIHGGWVAPFRNINWISVGLSVFDVNFSSNAIFSGNFRYTINGRFQSTLTGSFDPLDAAGTMLGGVVGGGIEYGLRNSWAYPAGVGYGMQFFFTTIETGIGF